MREHRGAGQRLPVEVDVALQQRRVPEHDRAVEVVVPLAGAHDHPVGHLGRVVLEHGVHVERPVAELVDDDALLAEAADVGVEPEDVDLQVRIGGALEGPRQRFDRRDG